MGQVKGRKLMIVALMRPVQRLGTTSLGAYLRTSCPQVALVDQRLVLDHRSNGFEQGGDSMDFLNTKQSLTLGTG